MQVVALHLDVGRFGLYLIGDTLGAHHEFLECHFGLLQLHLDILLRGFDLYHLALEADHTEAEDAARVNIHGKTAVHIGDGNGPMGGGIDDRDTQERFLGILVGNFSREAEHFLCRCAYGNEQQDESETEGQAGSGAERLYDRFHLILRIKNGTGLLDEINKGHSSLEWCEQPSGVVGTSRIILSGFIELLLIDMQTSYSHGGLQTPMPAQHEAIAVGESAAKGISLVTGTIEEDVVGGGGSHQTHEMSGLWTGAEPITRFGSKGQHLGMEIAHTKQTARNLGIKREMTIDTKLRTKIR